MINEILETPSTLLTLCPGETLRYNFEDKITQGERSSVSFATKFYYPFGLTKARRSSLGKGWGVCRSTSKCIEARTSGSGTFLLEFITYLFISVMLLTAVFVLVVRLLAFNKQLERGVLTECALHNAITLFRRDAVYMPSARAAYSTLLPNRISFAISQQGTVSWYFDNKRLMRAHFEHEKQEYAVVLEPVEQGAFVALVAGQHVRTLEIGLSHNEKFLKHKIWIVPGNL